MNICGGMSSPPLNATLHLLCKEASSRRCGGIGNLECRAEGVNDKSMGLKADTKDDDDNKGDKANCDPVSPCSSPRGGLCPSYIQVETHNFKK